MHALNGESDLEVLSLRLRSLTAVGPLWICYAEAGATDVGPLSEAAARGDLQKMSLLLASGSDVDERDRIGSTATLLCRA